MRKEKKRMNSRWIWMEWKVEHFKFHIVLYRNVFRWCKPRPTVLRISKPNHVFVCLALTDDKEQRIGKVKNRWTVFGQTGLELLFWKRLLCSARWGNAVVTHSGAKLGCLHKKKHRKYRNTVIHLSTAQLNGNRCYSCQIHSMSQKRLRKNVKPAAFSHEVLKLLKGKFLNA